MSPSYSHCVADLVENAPEAGPVQGGWGGWREARVPGEGSGLVASALVGVQQVMLGNDWGQVCGALGQESGHRPEGSPSRRLAPEGLEDRVRWVVWAPEEGSWERNAGIQDFVRGR